LNACPQQQKIHSSLQWFQMVGGSAVCVVCYFQKEICLFRFLCPHLFHSHIRNFKNTSINKNSFLGFTRPVSATVNTVACHALHSGSIPTGRHIFGRFHPKRTETSPLGPRFVSFWGGETEGDWTRGKTKQTSAKRARLSKPFYFFGFECCPNNNHPTEQPTTS
jgi:hypothetical protein